MSKENLSFGEDLVGITFNPSSKPEVDDVKTTIARLADLVNDTPTNGSYTDNTLKGDAIRELLHAQMSVVKFLTYKK